MKTLKKFLNFFILLMFFIMSPYFVTNGNGIEIREHTRGCFFLNIFGEKFSNVYRFCDLASDIELLEGGKEKKLFFNSRFLSARNKRRTQMGKEKEDTFIKVIMGDSVGKFQSQMKKWEWSPDGRKIAIAICEKDKNVPNDIFIVNVIERKLVLKKHFAKRHIIDFTWDSTSEQLVILLGSERKGLKPLELLAMISGHPVPYVSFALSVQNIKSGEMIEYPVVKNIKYGSGVLLWVNN